MLLFIEVRNDLYVARCTLRNKPPFAHGDWVKASRLCAAFSLELFRLDVRNEIDCNYKGYFSRGKQNIRNIRNVIVSRYKA